MADPLTTYSIFPLGDSAVTIDLGNCIDLELNIRALALHDWLQAHRFPGILDIIVAYSSVSVFFDPPVVVASGVNGTCGVGQWVVGLLREAWAAISRRVAAEPAADGHTFRIPVCYEGEYAPDMQWVARNKGLTEKAVIDMHCAKAYRVYMVGFLPGFSYMGTVDPRLELPRKQLPVNVVAGGVGIAGLQTGIYPLTSPGGWQIIGRTPVKLFDPLLDPPVRLQSGDHVQFYPVSRVEFQELTGRPA